MSNFGFKFKLRRYTLVVRAVTEAEAGPAREAALALLAAIASSDAQGVMEHVLEAGAYTRSLLSST